MPTASGTVAAAFVISLHMVLQCSGKIPSIQQRKHQVKIQEKQLNSTNQTAEDITTTVVPVNPYVFLAEDYDIRQDAESLQKALLIVAYEPQKIDAKKPKVDATKGNATLVTPPSVNPTTETVPEKEYYEVPRRALRSRRAHVKPAEADFVPEAKLRSITRPRSEPDSTPSPSSTPSTPERTTSAQLHPSSETPSPAGENLIEADQPQLQVQVQVQVQGQTTTTLPLDRIPRPFSIPTDASPTSSNHHDRHYSLPFKSTDLAPTVSVKSPGAYSSASLRHIDKTGRIKVDQAASAAAPVEHPYLPPYATDDFFFAPRQGSARLNHLYTTPRTTAAAEYSHLAPHSTASAADPYASPYTLIAVDQKHGPPYSSAPVDPIPPRQYPASYSTPPVAQRRTTTYPTDPTQQEPIGKHQTYPSRRHSARRNEQWDHGAARTTRPVDHAGGGGTPSTHRDESYGTQRRRSRARVGHTSVTTSPEHQTLGYGTVPARAGKQSRLESTPVYSTAPTWREEVQVYLPAKSRRQGRPPRREDDPGYSGKPPRRTDHPSYLAEQTRREEERNYSTEAPKREEESFFSLSRQEAHARPASSSRREQKSQPSSSTGAEEKQSSPTVSSSQSEEQDYSTASSESDEEQSYSTPPSRREHSQNYEVSSLRRAKPTLAIAADHTAVPNEEIIETTRPPPRRKPLPEDDEDYDQDIAPPTASAEQSLDYTNDAQPTQALKQKQRPSEYQEYIDATDYTDYTEPRSKDKDENQNKIRDKDKEKNEDHKQYSFSHVERVEEPLDESGEASYNVHEVSDEEPQQPQPRPAGTHPVLQRGGYKIVHQPIVVNSNDQLQEQLPPADYQEQAEAQKADQQVTQETKLHQHKPKGDQAEDLAQSAGHHHKKHDKPKKEHHDEEEGGHGETHEGQHHEKGHKGHKDYKEYHEHDEGKKGHHDKEDHNHHYDEKKGGEKKHHEEAGHHEVHEKGEEGEKKHAFKEKGHHNKGHSTKGEHVVHKKDAFEKKIEFYDEFHEGGEHEKHGAHHHEHHHKKGGHHHKGHHHKGEHEGHHGKKGHYSKGHHHEDKKGHKKDEGEHQHHEHHHKHGKKGGHEDHKQWHHKKG